METFWKTGDRVIGPYWTPSDPVGTVVSAEVATGDYSPSIGQTAHGTLEWMKVRFDDGVEKEYAAWDLRKAPES